MSYVATRQDISEAWEKFYLASEELGNVLKDATCNAAFTQRQTWIMQYLEAQLKADRFKIEKDVNEVLKVEEEE